MKSWLQFIIVSSVGLASPNEIVSFDCGAWTVSTLTSTAPSLIWSAEIATTSTGESVVGDSSTTKKYNKKVLLKTSFKKENFIQNWKKKSLEMGLGVCYTTRHSISRNNRM